MTAGCLVAGTLATYGLFTCTPGHAVWVEQVGGAAAEELNQVPVIGARFRTVDGSTTPSGSMSRVYRTDRADIGWVASSGEQGSGTLRDYARGGAFLAASVYYAIANWAPGRGDDDLYAPFEATVHGIEVEDFGTCFVGERGIRVRGAEA